MLSTAFLIGSSPTRRQSDDDFNAHFKHALDEQCATDSTKKKEKTWYDHILSDIYLISILSYSLWIFSGVVFYKFYSSWTWATAYYYTMDAGLSIGFCSPADKDDWSKLFTIFYVLVGSSVIAGCLGLLANRLTAIKVSLVAVKHNFGSIPFHKDNGDYTLHSVSRSLWYRLKYVIGWYHNRPRTITITAFFVWMGLGTIYGMIVEDWTFITSLYWAITTCSTGGLQSAPCVHGTDGTTCDMGNMRGSVMGVFMMIGVPLYAVTVSQFARFAVHRAIVAQEERMINRPIEDAEFLFAANILSPEGSTTLVLGEYILLELMRLGATNQNQIEILKTKFAELDRERRGELDIEDMHITGKVVPRKLSSVEMARKLRSRSLELLGFNNSPVPKRDRSQIEDESTARMTPPKGSDDLEKNEVALVVAAPVKSTFAADSRKRGSKKGFAKASSVRFHNQNDEDFLADAIGGDSTRSSPVPNGSVPRGYSFTDFEFNIDQDESDEGSKNPSNSNSYEHPSSIPTVHTPGEANKNYGWESGSYHSHSSDDQPDESTPTKPAASYVSETGLFVDV